MHKAALDKKTKTVGNNFLLLLAGVLFLIVATTLFMVTGNKPDYTSLIQEAESNLIIESDSLLKKAARKEAGTPSQTKTIKTEIPKAETREQTPTTPKTEPPKEVVSSSGGSAVHKVQRGETLLKIAAKYGVSAEQIKAANNLIDDNLQIDQVLQIPAGDAPITPTKHIVKSGEGLFAIARKYNVNVKALMKANNLSEEQSLMEGQELIIPPK